MKVLISLMRCFSSLIRMFAKVYNLRFPSVADAKIAASYFADNLGGLIVECQILSLNISLGQCGSLTIQTKFETSEQLRNFEAKSLNTFKDLKQSLVFTENQYVGVYTYAYEAEAVDAKLSVN